ncbi:hypothetical protein LEN26_001209 [Aphanomyces euteiches]|nr:hypothetical protein AeMF1_015172 [Aphanomyces euteiches]KAH9161871.1 hypothetical protein LEN26_001209 [Aphanomyces euteiches]
MSFLSLVFPCAPLDSAASSVDQAFGKGIRPIPLEDGTGGVYACRALNHRFVGVFKPTDEEPAARFNPKGYTDVVRQGIPVSQMAIRECMAFLADVDNFAKVPPTALAYAKHDNFNSNNKKLGSFQTYCPHDCSAEDLGPSVFSTEQVHAIACLDIRLMNQDRHSGNLLVQRTDSQCNLIPIDHGCCLPELKYLEDMTFAWMYWPQAKVPLSSTTKAYVSSLDSFAQAKTMKHLQAPVSALVTLHVGTLVLKKCVSLGLTLFEIAQLMVRPTPSTPSPLEGLVRQLAHLDPESHIQTYLRVFEVALDKLVRRLYPSSNSPTVAHSNSSGYASYPQRKSYAKVLLSSAA